MKPMSTTLVLAGCITVICAHAAVLSSTGLSAQQSPLAALSQTSLGNVHALELVLFAVANMAMAWRIQRPEGGLLMRVPQLLFLLAGVLLIMLTYEFTLPSAAQHAQSLWILASVIGICMGCLVPTLRKTSPLASKLCLIVLCFWVLLIPVGLWVPDLHTGTYQRSVGLLYIAWLAAMALLIRVPKA